MWNSPPYLIVPAVWEHRPPVAGVTAGVCRLCLAADATMVSIVGTPLQQVYERLTTVQLASEGRPLAACRLCHGELQSCLRLAARAARADALLTAILHSGARIDEDTVSLIDRGAHSLSQTLTRTPIQLDHYGCELEHDPLWPPDGDHMDEVPCCDEDVKHEGKEHIDKVQCCDEDVKHEDEEDEETTERIEVELVIDIKNEQQEKVEDASIHCDGADVCEDGILTEQSAQSDHDTTESTDSDVHEDRNSGHGTVDISDKAGPQMASVQNQSTLHTIISSDKSSGANTTVGDNKTKCPVCSKTFTKRYMKKHVVTHRPLECVVCCGQFSDRSSLKTHVATHAEDSPGQCVVCGHRFKHKENLEIHLISKHIVKKPYQCAICKSEFATEKYLIVHQNKQPVECNICCYRFCTVNKLIQHIRTHKRKSKYVECNICSKTFNKKYMKTHVTRHAALPCAVCRETFNDRKLLREHLGTHAGEKPYKCKICEQIFKLKESLKEHLMMAHMAEKPFRCVICDVGYCQKKRLAVHMKSSAGRQPLECDRCHRRFCVRRTLIKHIRTHHTETPFQCGVCGYRFMNNCALERHVRQVHMREKPFKCSVCELEFPCTFSLKVHFRKHAGEKPYECAMCQHQFRRRQHLVDHLRTHTGEKPFECGTCKRRFNQSGSLGRHLKTHIRGSVC